MLLKTHTRTYVYIHTHTGHGHAGRGQAPLNWNSCILVSLEHFQLGPSRKAPLYAWWLALCAPMLVTSSMKHFVSHGIKLT